MAHYLTTLKRHRIVYNKYLEILKSYGDDANFIQKSFFYKKTAESVGLSPDRAKKIICKEIRKDEKKAIMDSQ